MPNTSSSTVLLSNGWNVPSSYGVPLIECLLHVTLYDRDTVWILKETASVVEQVATENNWTWEKWKYLACISRNFMIYVVHQI